MADDTGILYDFITYAEWPQEPELIVKTDDWITNKHVQSAKNALSSIVGSLTSYIPAEVSRHINHQLSWQYAVGGNGKVVCVLQDVCIEIRSSKDDYSSIVGKFNIAKDPFPQWRRIAWSPDCNMLVLSYSDGSIDCFDALGCKLFSIPSKSTSYADLGEAFAAVLFVDTRTQKSQWSCEVVVISYKGLLRSYFVSPTDGFQESHTFSLSSYFSSGVTSAVYHTKYNIILVSGSISAPCSGDEGEICSAAQCGLAMWRVLSDTPYYRLSLTLNEEIRKNNASQNLLRRIPSMIWYRSEKPDTILKIGLSPEGSLLAVIHVSGALSIWNIPSLKLKKMYPLEEQPDFESENPTYFDFTTKKKKAVIVHSSLRYHLADVNWWSEEAVILGRYSGSVSVSSVENLRNLLGTSLEWFESPPQVSAAYNKFFLVMECENEIIKKRRSSSPDDIVSDDAEPIDDSSGDDESDEDNNFIRKSSRFAKTALYYMTDNDRFRPPRKRARVFKKTFRLLCLKATTPEELFARKLDNEEYGEAISLAQIYGLDCDLVYQRQWRNVEVSVTSIQDYLSKITKRSWVLHECLDRMPKDIDSTRALLNYGLQGTDLEALISIGNNTDEGKFFVCDSQHDYESFDVVPNDILFQSREIIVKKARDTLLAQVNFSDLTPEQKQLCYSRHILLQYVDRLTTYEIMLGGPAVANEYFDYTFFHTFRAQPSLEAALQFAHQSNWQAVAAMFTYHGKETLPHRLAILWNFPETMPPFVYRSLLPECGYGFDEPAVIPWEQEIIREQDWVEPYFQRNDAARHMQSLSFLYEDNLLLQKFNCMNVTRELITLWYIDRAINIEHHSRLINSSLELIKLGMERNVQGLEKLHDDFVTMEVLVYECYIDDEITFECFQSMSKLEVIHLMMSTSTEANFVKNLRRWLFPFLSRCEKHETCNSDDVMESYLVSLATHDLTLCVKIFQNFSADPNDIFINPMATLVKMALSCIYACQDDQQLSNANAILECFPQRGFGVQTEEILGLHDKLDLLEKHLNAAEILEKYEVFKPIAYVKVCHHDVTEAKQLLALLTRSMCRKDPPLDEVKWAELLEDVLELQVEVFQCVDIDFCIEIFAESLLCSGRKEIICLAGGLLTHSKVSSGDKDINPLPSLVPSAHKITQERANLLVIKAAKEYFNSCVSFSDSAMDLAKQCLLLVHSSDCNVQAELDFINALPILNYFDINLLPMQVRMCENRLDLIKQVFKTCPDAYKESQKLLSLAHFLRVDQDVKLWEEQVYILMASAAFKAQDYYACCRACQCLMTHKYSNGWEVCLELGKCESFKNVEARCQLLAFSEIYCLDNYLEEIITTKHILESCVLQDKLQTLIDLANALKKPVQATHQSDVKREKLDHPFQKAKNIAAHLQQYTTQTTKQIMSTVGKAEFFKQAISWLRPTWHLEQSSDLEDFSKVGGNPDQLFCPEFYASVLPNALESPIMPKYNSYASPQDVDIYLSIGLLIIQLALMDNKAFLDEQSSSLAVLQQVSENLLSKDSSLGLAHLLVLDDPLLIDDCFCKFPSTGTSLQFAMYCFGLLICHSAELIPRAKLYSCSPKMIMKNAVRYAQTWTGGKSDKKMYKCCKSLLSYERRWADYIQGRLLQSLGRGVDVARFSQDDQYKHETVLGLIMTIDDKVYKTALALACKYHVPLWEVHMSHLEYLFAEEEISPSNIGGRVNDLGFLHILFQEPQKFLARMESIVYSTISGLDHPRLLYYYSLLEQCNPKDKIHHSHIVLLRRLKDLGHGLDYKALTSGTNDVLSSLSPVLTGNNIQSFAKLSSQLTKCCKQTIEASMIYRTWARKLFFSANSDDSSTSASHEWISRYNASKNYFDKLKPEDLIEFLKETLFVEKALDEFPDGIRKELLQRTLKFAQLELGKCKEQSKQRSEWQQAIDFCHVALEHLEWMQSKYITAVKESDIDMKFFVRALDLSLSNPEKVKALLYHCVLDGNSLETLQQVISLCPPQLYEHPGNVIVEILLVIQSSLRNQSVKYDSVLQNRNCVQVLEAVTDTIKSHIENGGNLVNLKEVSDHLLPLCTDNTVTASVRRQVISMLEKMFPGNSSEMEMLSLYKAQAIIAGSWPDLEVFPDKLESKEFQEEMICRLLSLCQTLQQLDALADLLMCWSSLSSACNESPEENSWCKIMTAMLEMPHDAKMHAVVNVVRKLESSHIQLSIKCLEVVLLKILEEGTFVHSLKFALLTSCKRLHDMVLMEAEKLSEDVGITVDDEICSLLVKRKLISNTVKTVLYQSLLTYILSHESPSSVKDIVRDLKQNGYYCEAASLFIMSSGVPRSLTNFDAATKLLNIWV